ncbi:MAG: FAD-dependent oxidoreductase, partial [Pseudonocardiaceae bacterium]|nr:FAD-dependent oxidoreductase [Pseudonocardiaceae bacterium]
MIASAQIVIIGAGIVGTSAAYHLALRACTDVLVVDQGPLPATGGSSSHAPGLVFQTNASQPMTHLAASSVEQLGSDELAGELDEPCYYPVGGIEVATTAGRWDDLHRKHGLATAWGVAAELLGPAQIGARIPQLDTDRILGGLHVPTDGIAKPVRAVEAMARRARRLGVRFWGHTEVTGFDRTGGKIDAVHTTGGTIATGGVLCCAGIWGPRVGRLAGVSIPVQPLAHQYVVTTPVPGLD